MEIRYISGATILENNNNGQQVNATDLQNDLC